ncbi:MAG: hypothetical protein ACRDV4_11095, partial [Acidimicrobiales bacterium]
LHPDSVARAVRTVVETPPGVHLTLVEVQPVAPVSEGPVADSREGHEVEQSEQTEPPSNLGGGR